MNLWARGRECFAEVGRANGWTDMGVKGRVD